MFIASVPDSLRCATLVGLALALATLGMPAIAAEESAEALQKKCDAKDWAACVELGDEYNYSEFSESNKTKAVALYRRACDAKFMGGCDALGNMYDTGSGVAKDPGKAVALFRQACEANDSGGCEDLARSYVNGSGVPKDLKRAAELYQKACDLKNGDACWYLSTMYSKGEGVAKDEAKSRALNQLGCDLGSDFCQIVAYEVAVGFYQDACEGGDAEACFMIGSAYEFGWHNLAIDPLTASIYYDRSCDGDHAKACFMLALLYLDGKGVEKDAALADKLFHEARDLADKSCAANSKTAARDCRALGAIYNLGLGVAADPARAQILYQKSCRLGDKEACDLKVANAAAPRPKPAVAAPAAQAKSASASCKIARVQLGVDTVATVERDIQARGGSPLAGGGGLAKHRVSALSGDYADSGPEVMAVSYDFDAPGPGGRLVAVTIVNHANNSSGYEQLLATRKAAASAIAGPLQQKSATELVASGPGCQLRLLQNAGAWYIHEVYQLPN
jgi:hypothetical protein